MAKKKIKRWTKRYLDRLVATIGRQNWYTLRPSLLIITYHRILPMNHPDMPIIQPGMVVSNKTFEMHIKLLRKKFTIMHLSDWIRKAQSGERLPSKACAITFDDGWHDNYEHAFPLLKKYNVPATIYLVSDMIGTDRSFWPERLARIVWNNGNTHRKNILKLKEFEWIMNLNIKYMFDTSSPTRDEIDEIIEKAKKYSDRELENKLDEMEEYMSKNLTYGIKDLLNWEQVIEMSDSCGLIELGSHTRHHRRLTAIDKQTDMLDEIVTSKKILESMGRCSVDTFCYPNGDITNMAAEIVKEHYLGACTTLKGWNNVNTNPYELRRISLHEDSAWDKSSLLARISGWF